MKIRFTLPNGKTATRRLDEFMHKNFLTRAELRKSPAPVERQEEAGPRSLDVIVDSWPGEINSILENLVSGDVSAEIAFDMLEDRDDFMDWNSSLIGTELTGVRQGGGTTIDDTLTIKSIRKNTAGRPTIYLQRPDERRVTMSLERFLKNNMTPKSEREQLAEVA